MEATNEDRATGGIVVIVDPDHPGEGWLEMQIPLEELLIYPGASDGEPTVVGVQFDYSSGSVCHLVKVVAHAHDRLVELINADEH